MNTVLMMNSAPRHSAALKDTSSSSADRITAAKGSTEAIILVWVEEMYLVLPR